MEDHFIPNPEQEIPQAPPVPDYTAHGRELIFAAAMAVLAVILVVEGVITFSKQAKKAAK